MQTNNILSAELIDIIFAGRNKEYGAYELRKYYGKRINRALLITMIIAGSVFGGAMLASAFQKKSPNYNIKEGVILTDLPPDEKKPEPPLEKPKPQEVQEVKTQKLTVFVPVPDAQVQTSPPEQADLVDTKISTFTKGGDPYDGIDRPQIVDSGKGIVQLKSIEPEEPYTIVEIDAKFSGNWKAFLERNLNPEVPIQNNAPAGRYSVVVRFVVDKEGNVSDIEPQTNHGYGMEAEAVRVLKKAARWEPAIQNGYKVKAYRVQVIVFEVNEE